MKEMLVVCHFRVLCVKTRGNIVATGGSDCTIR